MSFFCITNKITELGKKSSWSEASPTPKFCKKSRKIIAILDLRVRYFSEPELTYANGLYMRERVLQTQVLAYFCWGEKNCQIDPCRMFEAISRGIKKEELLQIKEGDFRAFKSCPGVRVVVQVLHSNPEWISTKEEVRSFMKFLYFEWLIKTGVS